MGGGQIYIPILYWLGMDFKYQAIPLGLLLNFSVQISAFSTYVRNKLVDFNIALPFALSMIIFTPLGAILNFNLSSEPIIILFSLFTFFAGILAVSNYKTKRENSIKKRKTYSRILYRWNFRFSCWTYWKRRGLFHSSFSFNYGT